MAKRLNTTVHLTDEETGESRILGPKSKLSAEDVSALQEGWGKHADRFLVDDEDDDGPNLSVEDHLKLGHPPADRVPADPASPEVEEAMELNVKARTKANPRGVADSEKSGEK